MHNLYDNRAIRSDGHVAASDAAQFMPFAALRGLDVLLDRKSKSLLKVSKHELTPEEAHELSQSVRNITRGDRVSCEFYKDGEYQHIVGIVERLDLLERWIVLDSTTIAFEDLKVLRVV